MPDFVIEASDRSEYDTKDAAGRANSRRVVFPTSNPFQNERA